MSGVLGEGCFGQVWRGEINDFRGKFTNFCPRGPWAQVATLILACALKKFTENSFAIRWLQMKPYYTVIF